MPKSTKHEHPGGDVPHRHNPGDELAAHATGSTTSDASDQTLQLSEEELQARKQQVDTGRVRVGKEIVEEHSRSKYP